MVFVVQAQVPDGRLEEAGGRAGDERGRRQPGQKEVSLFDEFANFDKFTEHDI
jgi:hypothetical protein